MAQKAMLFVDGSWLYRSRPTLFAKLGEENFEIDYARLPRILCEDVANALDEDVKQALAAGMNAHIAKPLDVAVLSRTLAKLIEGGQAA